MINENENMTERSVTAIAKSGSRLKAVELNRQGGTIEVTRTKSSEENVINWQDFAAKCGLSIGPFTEEDKENQKALVVGYDSAGTAFSRVSIPAVEDKEIESMVHLQAESRLPLPADQMELAWRADKAKGDQLEITIAAARRQQVQNFVSKINSFRPTNIYLDCEGIVKVWKEIFSGSGQNAVIINADARNTQLCLVQNGKLINAIALDMGIDDFAEAEAEEQTENIERFVQDTRSVVDLFGIEKSEKLKVFILSDGSETYSDLAASLKDTGLNAAIAKPDTTKFSAKSRLNIKDIFEYRMPIGLALMLIESNGSELNLFSNQYKPFGAEKQLHWIYNPKFAGAAAVVVLALFLGITYAIDVAKPGLMQTAIQTHGRDLPALVEQQSILNTIERNRPDLLRLISELSINNDQAAELAGRRGGPMNRSGIQLESFDYKKGKVTINGTASDNVALYNFEEQLGKKRGISGVKTSTSANRTAGRTGTITSTRTAPSTRTTNTNTRGGNIVGGSTNTRGGGTTSPSAMRGGVGGENIRFSMEFNYGTVTSASSQTLKK